MSGGRDPIPDPYAAIEDALNVLGRGRCSVNTCQGCEVEREEAVAVLTISLARRDGALCERCQGERWVEPAPDSTFDRDLCPICGGSGVREGYNPLAAYFGGVA